MTLEGKTYTEAKTALGLGTDLGCRHSCLQSFGGALLIILGIVLCFTGIGMILGIPLIIVGLVFSVFSFLLKGKCPWCGTEVKSSERQGFDCPACKKRIVIKEAFQEHRFYKFE